MKLFADFFQRPFVFTHLGCEPADFAGMGRVPPGLGGLLEETLPALAAVRWLCKYADKEWLAAVSSESALFFIAISPL